MAETYYRSSRHGSTRNIREEPSSHRTKRHRDHRSERKRSDVEAKTPPLPRTISIEELLKQRETLKDELKKMAKYTEHNLEKKCELNKKQSKKRLNDNKEDQKTKKNKTNIKETSPDCNEDTAPVESEDEESIIENRRKKRKQLLEKLQTTQKDTDDIKEELCDAQSASNEDSKKNHNSKIVCSTNKCNKVKETGTDMFAEIEDFLTNKAPDQVKQDNAESNTQLNDNWDDSDGYYNVKIGDKINNNKYCIKNILGRGVFANVLRAQDLSKKNTDVAIKIIRNNDLMYRTGLKEISILKQITEADPERKYHCVQFLGHFKHKGHLCIILEPLCMDLRSVIKKYGKHHGINMKALMSYSRQLLLALRLLKKINVVHADIKPDNILVNEKKNILKLCDFGSASKVDDNEPTPYLVSRFYRAPEIILGIPYKHGVDMWSTACTIYEMATGKILFTGSSNNKMLKCFMDLKGKISSKLIRKGKFKDQHFNYNNNFLVHKKDEFTGREKVTEVPNIAIVRDLQRELEKSFKNLTPNEEKKLTHLKDLLDKMLMLDANQRITIINGLKHPFIQEELQK